MDTTTDTTDEKRPRFIAWNDPAILKAAGETPQLIRELLARHKQPLPTDWQVYQWSSRKRISHRWRPRAVYALLREGKIEIGKLFRLVASE